MPQQPEPGATVAPRPRPHGSSPLTLVGALLLLVGVVSMGWVGWQYYGTNITASKAFQAERDKLRRSWQEAPPASPRPSLGATVVPQAGEATPTSRSASPVPGEAMALLRIPELGPDFEYPVVAGIGEDELGRGLGWYPTSAMPGELGNFAVAGHRITHGEPFARLLEVKAGWHVEVETRTAVFVYTLTTAPSELTVSDADVWVVDPVPGKPADTVPTERLITLTTCTDLIASPKRSVAFGHLVEVRRK